MMGAMTSNARWVVAGLAMAVAWTAFFFAVNLVAFPARIHAGLVDKLNAAREETNVYHSVVVIVAWYGKSVAEYAGKMPCLSQQSSR